MCPREEWLELTLERLEFNDDELFPFDKRALLVPARILQRCWSEEIPEQMRWCQLTHIFPIGGNKFLDDDWRIPVSLLS